MTALGSERTQPRLHPQFLQNLKETNRRIHAQRRVELRDAEGKPREFRLYEETVLGLESHVQSLLVRNSRERDDDFPTDEEYLNYSQRKCLSDLNEAIARRQSK